MNALASALPLEDEVQSKIRKVRIFGRNARVVCWALLALTLIMCVLTLLFAVLGPILERKAAPLQYATLTSALTSFGFVLAAGYQLYRLFGNLAAGAIYTPENVRRVRNVGLLWLLFAVLGAVLPVTLEVANLLIDGSTPVNLKLTIKLVFASFYGLLKSFVSAGLVLLASWIMDVGLYEKQNADALRRDADLVI